MKGKKKKTFSNLKISGICHRLGFFTNNSSWSINNLTDIQKLFLQAERHIYFLRGWRIFSYCHRTCPSARRPLWIPPGLSSSFTRSWWMLQGWQNHLSPFVHKELQMLITFETVDQLNRWLFSWMASHFSKITHRAFFFHFLFACLFFQKPWSSRHFLQICHQLSQLSQEQR